METLNPFHECAFASFVVNCGWVDFSKSISVFKVKGEHSTDGRHTLLSLSNRRKDMHDIPWPTDASRFEIFFLGMLLYKNDKS
jgi:hypothetical protein